MLQCFAKTWILILLCLAVFSGCKENTQSLSGSTTGPGDEEIDWSVPESPTELMELSRRLKQRSDREIEILIDRLKFDTSISASKLGDPLEEIAEELLSLTLSEADRLGSLLEEQGRGTELALTITDRQAKARGAIETIQNRLTKLPEGYRDGDLYIASPLVVEKVKLPWFERQTDREFEQVVEVSFAREEYDFGPMPTDVSDDGMRFVGMLTGLRKLDIQQSEVGDRGLNELRHLQQLAVLDASGLNATVAGWETLTKLGNLRQLNLRAPKETPSEIGWAGQFPKLERLEALNVVFSRNSLRRLSRSRSLRTLFLSGMASEEELVLERIPNLSELNLHFRSEPETESMTSLDLQNLPQLDRVFITLPFPRDRPELSRLRRFELNDVPRLRSLSLFVGTIGSNALLSIGRLPAIRSLVLSGMTLPADTLHWLAGLNQLTELYCETDDGDRALQSLARLVSLRKFTLHAEELSGRGLESLAKLKNLELLRISGMNAEEFGPPILAGLPRLKELELNVGTVDALKLIDHSALQELRLNKMHLKDVKLDSLPQLKRLEVNYGVFTEIELKRLPKLTWCDLTSVEAARIRRVELEELPELRHFSLGPITTSGSISVPDQTIPLGDDFLDQFLPMQRLDQLWLRNVLVTDDGLMKLAHMEKLGSLSVSGPYVSPEAHARFRKANEGHRRRLREQRKSPDASKSD